jgi:hypothetical protein
MIEFLNPAAGGIGWELEAISKIVDYVRGQGVDAV